MIVSSPIGVREPTTSSSRRRAVNGVGIRPFTFSWSITTSWLVETIVRPSIRVAGKKFASDDDRNSDERERTVESIARSRCRGIRASSTADE